LRLRRCLVNRFSIDDLRLRRCLVNRFSIDDLRLRRCLANCYRNWSNKVLILKSPAKK
jgi:hypothetical protein